MTIEAVVAHAGVRAHRCAQRGVRRQRFCKALHERTIDAGAVAIITANYQLRGGKEAAAQVHRRREAPGHGGCDSVEDRAGFTSARPAPGTVEGRDVTFTEALADQSTECAPVPVGA